MNSFYLVSYAYEENNQIDVGSTYIETSEPLPKDFMADFLGKMQKIVGNKITILKILSVHETPEIPEGFLRWAAILMYNKIVVENFFGEKDKTFKEEALFCAENPELEVKDWAPSILSQYQPQRPVIH